MKKFLWLVVLISCVGCVTVKIPKYLQDQFPYKKKFYANFDDTLTATQQALKEAGWRITETANPSVFEQGPSATDASAKQILLFTEVRQTPLFLSSRYMSLNIYVRQAADGTDVEIRYISFTPALFKNIQSYKNDVVVYKIFDKTSEILER